MDIKLFGDKLVPPGSVEGLASRIFKCSVIGANALKGAAERKVSRPVWLSIVFEHMFFYIALTRSRTWSHLPEDKQVALTNNVADVLITAVVDFVFEDGTAATNAARVEQFKADLTSRLEDYGTYAHVVRESESDKPEGTALWAFCKQVAALSGGSDDVVYIMVAHGHVYDSMMAIGMVAPELST